MFVDHLQLTDFRSYESVDLPLQAGVTTFVGANGQGKTNLVEALEYLSTMSSASGGIRGALGPVRGYPCRGAGQGGGGAR